MLVSFVLRIVSLCQHYARSVALLALIATIGMGAYVATNLRISTDIDGLLAQNLDWRKRETELAKTFPHKSDRLIIVIDGETPDAADMAVATLTERLTQHPEMFRNVTRPDALSTFQKSGFLFMDEAELSATLEMLIKGQPLLGTLAADPSLRGFFGILALAAEGAKRGDVDYEKLEAPLSLLTNTLDEVQKGSQKPFPWRGLMSNGQHKLRDTRKFILTQPVLDFASLMPGAKARDEVQRLAAEVGLTAENGVRVRMTGSVALNDDEFSSVANGTTLAGLVSVTLVTLLLIVALRTPRIIVPILLTLGAGLIATTAFATLAIGSLNLISVAFAVMFVGIAVDFGIQFGVRYRDARHRLPTHKAAMEETAKEIAMPLFLAASMTTAGFLAFTPTAYRGVAELGWIASAGMVIAFLFNISLLPALITLFKPHAMPEGAGYPWAAPIDQFLQKHKSRFRAGGLLLGALGLVVALNLRFDFDPLNLKDPASESMQTLRDVMQDKNANPYTVEILTSDLNAARDLATQLEKLPEVDHAMTLASFVPKDQEKKLALIEDANFILAPTLNPPAIQPAPDQTAVIESMTKAATALEALGEDKIAAQRLATVLRHAATSQDGAFLSRLNKVLVSGLTGQLETIRKALSAEPVSLETLGQDLRNDWVAPDGRARVEVHPKGDASDHEVLAAFTKSVRALTLDATGPAVSIQESGNTISGAFVEAGALGILAIAALAYFFLRRLSDVLRLLAPLLLAGVLTLATMVFIQLPLNFANIIALPLLLSLGVSYAIYFVMAWRQGVTHHLQTPVARAVLFSAATTLVAFGSLALSAHVGTSGMGKLLTIALLYSLLCTFLLLPPLLGPARSRKDLDK